MKFCLGHPPINPLNGKAQALPVFNPLDKHGRVFFFSWLAFMLSFMSWYAFPPLMTSTIRPDLGLTRDQVLNSNIVALVAGFVMRFLVGPLCDMFGPRRVMAGILVAAAIPCGLAGTITNVTGLYLIRFFLGVAGASFVPCQVWCTGFYDKNVVGTANAFAAGWGNAGGGITYFVMPAIYSSLRSKQGLSSHVAWRVAFVVPCILLLATAAGVLFLCQDTPTGKWADRHLVSAPPAAAAVEAGGSITSSQDDNYEKKGEATATAVPVEDEETKVIEVVQKPSFKATLGALCCLQTLMLAAPYACSFGGELAINSILSSWYLTHLPRLGQQTAGQWAAMFGLLNVVTRPAGGFISDWIYRTAGPSRGVHFKKYWYGFLVFMQGVACLTVGLVDPTSLAGLVGGVAAIAIPMDAANGAAYALVPHVNPMFNGVMSGTVGATGNLGGVIFSVIFRFVHPYARSIAVIGGISMGIGALMTLVHPIPKSQRGSKGYMSS